MTGFLTAELLSFSAGGRRLVDGVNISASPGSVLAICGPNGAGKSTLLRLLSGELRPASGELRIEGKPIHEITQSRLAAKRAAMLQSTRVAFPFTAFEVVRLGAERVGVGLSAQDRDRLAEAALSQADAEEFAGQNYQTLSGGEQQRINFARALAQLAAGRTIETRQILLLDEPTSSLDIRHQLSLLQHARTLALRGDLLVIVVLHDLTLARTFADRILIMQSGRLAADATSSSPLPRATIEQIFGVSIAADTCPPAPWLPKA